jgi:hypothetical protein
MATSFWWILCEIIEAWIKHHKPKPHKKDRIKRVNFTLM